MTPFFILLGATCLIATGVMGVLAHLSRQVPDEPEEGARRRLSPDMLRLLAWATVALIVLFATMYELRLMYDL